MRGKPRFNSSLNVYQAARRRTYHYPLAAMRLLDLAPLAILASTLFAIPYAANTGITEPGGPGTRVVPHRPAAALIMRRTNKCPKKHHRCYGGCCPEKEQCCDRMFWTLRMAFCSYSFTNSGLLRFWASFFQRSFVRKKHTDDRIRYYCTSPDNIAWCCPNGVECPDNPGR